MSALDAVRQAEIRASMLSQTIYIVRYGLSLHTMTMTEVIATNRQADILEAVHP